MRKIFIILYFIFLANSANATSYYVKSSGGNDANTGLSDSQAWSTISKVNGFTFASGDTIYFKRGSTWREQLVVPASNLTFDAYGSGSSTNPTIKASEIVTGWADQTGNVWKATVETEPKYTGSVYFDGAYGQKVANVGALAVAKDWVWDTGELYTYAASDPDALYTAIEVGKRDTAIYMNGKNNVKLKHLTTNSTNGTNQSSIYIYDSDSVEVDTVTVNDTQRGILVWASDSAYIHDSTLTDCEICFSSGGDSTNTVFKDNSVSSTRDECMTSEDRSTNYSTTNLLIKNNTFTTCGKNCANFQYLNGAIIEENTCNGTGKVLGTDANGFAFADNAGTTNSIVVRYNYITDVDASSQGNGIVFYQVDNPKIYYNIIYDTYGFGISIYDGVDNAEVYNNTIYDAGDYSIYVYNPNNRPTVQANISYSPTTGHVYLVDGVSLMDYGDFDMNTYDNDTGTKFKFGSTSYNFADWQSNSFQDPSSNIGDPGFTAPPLLLTLRSTASVNINQGVYHNLPRDYRGKPIKNRPDRGAMEYGAFLVIGE